MCDVIKAIKVNDVKIIIMIKCTYFSYARHTLSACVLIKKEHQHLLSYASIIINANHFFYLCFSSVSALFLFSLLFGLSDTNGTLVVEIYCSEYSACINK